MSNYQSRAKKVSTMVQELGLCTSAENGNSKIFGSEQYRQSGKLIAGWMTECGLETHTDNIGNIRGRYRSNNPQAKTFVIASHYGLQGTTGKYDGALGIATGIDLAGHIMSSNISLPFHLEIIAITEKEGIRFRIPFMGSSVLAGNFNPLLFDRQDDDGTTLGDIVMSMNKKPEKIKSDTIPASEWLGFLEIQIDQSEELEQRNLPVGIVSAIAGQRRIEIHFAGKKGHAGTVPMHGRKDALCAAAQFILEVEEYAQPERRNLVATVGKIQVDEAAANSIPGNVTCSLDVRSSDPARLAKGYEKLNKICERICHKRGIYFEWKLLQETNPVTCDEKLNQLLEKSIRDKNLEVISMESGASHDGAIISRVSPVVMLTVKAIKGDKYRHVENVEVKDIAATLEISQNFLKMLAEVNEKNPVETI